ncbi:hypothetical protein BKA64DRAFT_255757 [Cadophora sp. MPI-SDFR-AT-0126]|nr:hypothetical protein BKA64DRAFT_255757 [Leotiomycetes sp. MPI-SDFR-AT-0126]
MAKKPKYQAYVVFKGRKPGIYKDWNSTNAQVHRFSGEDQRGFTTLEAAVQAWEEHARTVANVEIKEEESNSPSLPVAFDVLVKSDGTVRGQFQLQHQKTILRHRYRWIR